MEGQAGVGGAVRGAAAQGNRRPREAIGTGLSLGRMDMHA